jgi:peptidoglycan hydrolase CwlO-like protein
LHIAQLKNQLIGVNANPKLYRKRRTSIMKRTDLESPANLASSEEVAKFTETLARLFSIQQKEQAEQRKAATVMNRIKNIQAQVQQLQSKVHALSFDLADHQMEIHHLQREIVEIKKAKWNLTKEQAEEATAMLLRLRNS